MSAKCTHCRMPIFEEDGQSAGRQLANGRWVCDDCDGDAIVEMPTEGQVAVEGPLTGQIVVRVR